MQPLQIFIGSAIRIGRESWCLPYAGFLCNINRPGTSISRPGGYEVYRLFSNMPKSKKSRKPLPDEFLSLLLSNQNKILKRGMTWTEHKQKGTTFKVQSLAIANPGRSPMVSGRSPVVSGRSLMVSGRSPMVSERSPMVPGRFPMVSGRSPMVSGR